MKEFHNSLAICENLTRKDPKNAEWKSNEALACFQIGKTLAKSSAALKLEIRSMLTRARDILLELKQRSSLSALDKNRLEQIQALVDTW